jgi:uncharacterized membrane protein (DUF106 family)
LVFENLLNPILNPLLVYTGYFWTLFILSFVIALIITVIYKYTTNQSLMKDLKNELKEFQKEAKSLRDKPEEAMKVQKRMMETNSKYMMHSLKPMLFTFLPIIIFFGWMSAHLAYSPIMPNEEFSITMNFNDGANGNVVLNLPDGISSINDINQTILANQATWVLKGEEGEYLLNYDFNGITYSNEILITSEKTYKPPLNKIKGDVVKDIKVNIEAVKPFNNLSLFGWKPGWLGAYIILSMIFSTVIRKLMKVY